VPDEVTAHIRALVADHVPDNGGHVPVKGDRVPGQGDRVQKGARSA
jgi:hypothetical protein